jgi:D-3-phosphoglycerate dehydrogenase / 2-oxoglutarate reductase
VKKVLVNKPIHDDAHERLAQEFEVLTPYTANREEILEMLPGVNAIILCAGFKMFAEEMDHATGIEVIGRHGVELDIVDVGEATRRNIPVVFTPYGPTESTAEHAFMLMLATTRQVAYLDRETRKGNFNVRDQVVGFELYEAKLGVVGFGHIGQRLAEMCRNALKMKVYVFDPFIDEKKIFAQGAEKCDSLLELMEKVDILSLHIPSIESTHGLIDMKALVALGPEGFLINTSRGSVVDEAALVEALKNGIIAGAGLDVFDPEPPNNDNPLFAFDNVVLTPHLASFTEQGRRRMGMMVVEDVIKVLNGETPKYCANFDVLKKSN